MPSNLARAAAPPSTSQAVKMGLVSDMRPIVRHYLPCCKSLPYQADKGYKPSMENKSPLGQKLDACLSESGMTKADLARHFGIAPQSIQTWFKTGRIGKERFLELSKLFRKPLAYWLDADEESLLSDTERQLLAMFRELNDEHQNKALQDMNWLHNQSNPAKGPANPFPGAPKPPKKED